MLQTGTTCALGVVLSAPGWDYVIAPGEPLFGVNFDGVVRVREDGITKCNAAVVSDRHLLTAAHCFDSDWDGESDYRPEALFVSVFELSRGTANIEFTAADVAIPDDWVTKGADIAVVTLPELAPADAPRYPVYGNRDEVDKPMIIVGHGWTGLGSTGRALFLDVKIAGRNRYDATREDLPSDEPLPPGGYLVYDFDSGSEANNTLAAMGISSDAGLGLDEAKSAMGDTGAPVFIDGAIAGIVSFGSFGYETDLLPDAIDTWGELGFDTRVSSFVPFILNATDDLVTVVPAYHPGDANRDYEFNQLGIVTVLAAGRYLTGAPARWSEGDWNEDDQFDQLDLVAALQTANYRRGPYAAIEGPTFAPFAASHQIVASRGPEYATELCLDVGDTRVKLNHERLGARGHGLVGVTKHDLSTVVPEPTTSALLLLGSCMLVVSTCPMTRSSGRKTLTERPSRSHSRPVRTPRSVSAPGRVFHGTADG